MSRRPGNHLFHRGPFAAELLGSAGYVALALFVVVILVAAQPRSSPSPPQPSPPPVAPVSRDAEILARASLVELVETQTAALQRWPRLLAELCQDPLLLETGLAPDCASGVITLSTDSYFERETGKLAIPARDKLQRAIPALLAKLRADPQIWQALDLLEVRGHADPIAVSDPYATNLSASQERAFSVLHFLTSDPGLPEQDRRDLQRLAIASGASHSRPPTDCRKSSRRCYAKARRVELRIRLNEASQRGEVQSLYDAVERVVSSAEPLERR